MDGKRIFETLQQLSQRAVAAAGVTIVAAGVTIVAAVVVVVGGGFVGAAVAVKNTMMDLGDHRERRPLRRG